MMSSVASGLISDKDKSLSADKIRADDYLFHKNHGLLQVQNIDYQNGKKLQFVCTKRNKAENKDVEVIFHRDEVEQGLVKKDINVDVKVHLSSLESSVLRVNVALDQPVSVFTEPISKLLSTGFMVFAQGSIIEGKSTFGEYGLEENSKMLLFPTQKSTKPEGVRWFCRFPKHNLEDYIYTSTTDQSICFVANEDVDILGWGTYIHQYDYVHYIRVTSHWKIYDSGNSGLLREGDLGQVTLENDKLSYDENKIMKYNFTTDFEKAGDRKYEAIRLNAGEHFHLKQEFYHSSYSEKFFYGYEGNDFAKAPNMDMGVFSIKDSDKFESGETTTDRGVIPGLLYQFA